MLRLLKVVEMMSKQYAIAFFEIVKEDNTLNDAKESFDVFMNVLKAENDFVSILNSPKIKVEEKKQIIKKIFSNCAEDFLLFLYVILDNGRIGKVAEIYDEFMHLYNEEKFIKIVEISSAEKLSSNEEKTLLSSLEKHFKGYEIIIRNKIDPRVVGGYHILVNGISMDLSFKRKIDNLERHILN